MLLCSAHARHLLRLFITDFSCFKIVKSTLRGHKLAVSRFDAVDKSGLQFDTSEMHWAKGAALMVETLFVIFVFLTETANPDVPWNRISGGYSQQAV